MKLKRVLSALLAIAMLITDSRNNEILTWVSGDKDSVKIGREVEKLPYENLYTEFDDKGNVIVRGLLHDEEVDKVVMKDDTTKLSLSKQNITNSDELPNCKMKVTDENDKVIEEWTSTDKPHIITGKLIVGETYIMEETQPADGFTTATDIEFIVKDNLGDIQTVTMVDETIKVKIVKVDATNTSRRLKNAEFEFKDSKGKKIATVKTNANGEAMIEGKLVAGEVYTITETIAPEGFELAGHLNYEVKDIGDIQVITIKDKPSTPKTGIFMKGNTSRYGIIIIAIIAGIGIVLFSGRKRKKLPKINR